jgi:hypothetical protein
VCWDKDCLEVKVVRSSHDQIITCDVKSDNVKFS